MKSTELLLKWFTPDYTNGPLEGYVLVWGVKGTHGSLVETTLNSYRALGLRPYTEYFFKVSAKTEGGQGPYQMAYQRTDISGKEKNISFYPLTNLMPQNY